MTKQRKFSILGPALAIMLILVGAVVVERWMVSSPERGANPTGEPASDAEMLSPTTAAPNNAPDSPDAIAWPTYHGGPALRGFAAGNVPDAPLVLWRYQADGAIAFASVADGRGIYACTTNGNVYALDFQGQERWRLRLTRTLPDGSEKPQRLEAPLMCFSAMVFVGTADGLLIALDVGSGEERWRHDVGSPILGGANFLPESREDPARVFVIGQNEGVLHCIRADTGALLWKGKAIARCDGSAAAGQEMVVYGSCAAALHVFSAQDGKHLRDIALEQDSQVAGGPALLGASIFSGSRSGILYHADASTGKIIWTNKESESELFTTPAVGEDLVVFASDDGEIRGIERRSGKTVWKFVAGGAATSPVMTSDKVIVGVDGVLYLLRATTGEKLWSYEISDSIASPAVMGDMVVVGSKDGSLTAFGARQHAP